MKPSRHPFKISERNLVKTYCKNYYHYRSTQLEVILRNLLHAQRHFEPDPNRQYRIQAVRKILTERLIGVRHE